MRNPARQAKVIVNRWRRYATEGNWFDPGEDGQLVAAERFLAGDRDQAAADAVMDIVADYYMNFDDDTDSYLWPAHYRAAQAVSDWVAEQLQ